MVGGEHFLGIGFGILQIRRLIVNKKILRIAAVITAIPAIILIVNTVAYALTGSGFLISGDSSINGARMFVAWISSSLAFCLFGASFCS
jgi:hypothetical protein